MYVRRTSEGVQVLAPAKLNLFFEILAKRPDGFHEIVTLMAPLDVYDTMVLRDAPPADKGSAAGPIALECVWSVGWQTLRSSSANENSPGPTGFEELPTGDENIAVRAIKLLRARAGVLHGAAVRLIKRIPVAAGLGGGSSDAAAALVAANVAWGLGWSQHRLSELGAELGSDVPFFLHAGPAICRGRGEQVEPVGRFGVLHVVVVRPSAGLSTQQVYGACQPSARPHSCAPLLAALYRGDADAMRRSMHNALEPAACSLSPWIERLSREFVAAGCLASQMSGSGSSYFGVCRNAGHAQSVARKLRARRLGHVFAAVCG